MTTNQILTQGRNHGEGIACGFLKFEANTFMKCRLQKASNFVTLKPGSHTSKVLLKGLRKSKFFIKVLSKFEFTC